MISWQGEVTRTRPKNGKTWSPFREVTIDRPDGCAPLSRLSPSHHAVLMAEVGHTCDVMNGILRALAADMPSRYPSSPTCHRYFQARVRSSGFIQILNVLAEDLYIRGKIDLSGLMAHS